MDLPRIAAKNKATFKTSEGTLTVARLTAKQMKFCELEDAVAGYLPDSDLIVFLGNPSVNSCRHEIIHYYIEKVGHDYKSIKKRVHGVEEFYVELITDHWNHIETAVNEVFEWARKK